MTKIEETIALISMAINRVLEMRRERTQGSLYCDDFDGLIDSLDQALTAVEIWRSAISSIGADKPGEPEI